MGQRGPKPGTWKMRPMPTNTATNAKAAPRFAPGAPKCPSWLSAAAKREFRRVVREMEAAGCSATVDVDLIASYATAVSDLAAIAKAIDKAGVFVDVPTFNRNGKPTGHSIQRANPLLKTKDALLGRVKQLADALGIGPAARSRQGATGAEPPKAANKVAAIRDRIQAARRAVPSSDDGEAGLRIAGQV